MPGLVGEIGGLCRTFPVRHRFAATLRASKNAPGVLVGFVRKDVLRFGPSVLEGGVAGHVFHQVQSGGFKFITDQTKVEQEDSEVILGALRIKVPLAAGGCPTVQCLGSDGQSKLQVSLDFSGMQCCLEPAELHRAPIPDIVQVDTVIT